MNNRNMEVDIASIKQKTFQKIHAEERRKKHRRIMILASAVASAMLLIGFNIEWSTTEVMQSLTVPAGEKATLILADGTKVVANSRTELVYPRIFKGNTREVTVRGEAYFEVAHDPEHPFIVKADQFNIKVLGTRFNVSNYDASASNVVLIQGSVELMTQDDDQIRMKPLDKVEICNGSFTSKAQVNPNDYTCWMDGIYYFNNKTVANIMHDFEKYYGVHVEVRNPRLKSVSLSGKFRVSEGLDYALDVMKNEVRFSYYRSLDKDTLFIN